MWLTYASEDNTLAATLHLTYHSKQTIRKPHNRGSSCEYTMAWGKVWLTHNPDAVVNMDTTAAHKPAVWDVRLCLSGVIVTYMCLQPVEIHYGFTLCMCRRSANSTQASCSYTKEHVPLHACVYMTHEIHHLQQCKWMPWDISRVYPATPHIVDYTYIWKKVVSLRKPTVMSVFT